MSKMGDYFLGIAESIERVLKELGQDVDEETFEQIDGTVCTGETNELDQLGAYISWAAQNAEEEARASAMTRACLVVMELDDIARARSERVAA